MKTAFECIPCFLNQALAVARKLLLSKERTESLLREMLMILYQQDWQLPPPVIARETQRSIRALTGSDDPYLEQKMADTRTALELLPEIETSIASSATPFLSAVQFSLAGNAIDFGATNGWDAGVRNTFQKALTRHLDENAVSRLKAAVSNSKNILFLADNVGEIVFDRPFLEQLGSGNVTVAVRGEPVLNDATMDDARRSGLTERFRGISNGSDVPGTWLDDCSDEFRVLFEKAELIVAKGQGNYECLSTVRRRICFLFMVKCSFVSQQVGMPTGSYAICLNNL
jgi:uncharacterized protein with ATP-grasp and redox domains